MSEGLSGELICFDLSKTPVGVHLVSLECGVPMRPIEVAPPGASLFEVLLAVDLDPDVTRDSRCLFVGIDARGVRELVSPTFFHDNTRILSSAGMIF